MIETKEVKELVEVDATYKTLAIYENVKVFVPNKNNDKYMVYEAANTFRLKKTGEIVRVPSHYRRGDLFPRIKKGKTFVTRRFYLNDALHGKKTVADLVTIKLKTDHFRDGEQSIVIDIQNEFGKKIENKAKFILKIGSPAGQHPIPLTNKFINLKKVD